MSLRTSAHAGVASRSRLGLCLSMHMVTACGFFMRSLLSNCTLFSLFRHPSSVTACAVPPSPRGKAFVKKQTRFRGSFLFILLAGEDLPKILSVPLQGVPALYLSQSVFPTPYAALHSYQHPTPPTATHPRVDAGKYAALCDISQPASRKYCFVHHLLY